MKGFLLDENLPSCLQCSPGLPVISFSKVSRHPSDWTSGIMPGGTNWSL
jgi:hypothetical protein